MNLQIDFKFFTLNIHVIDKLLLPPYKGSALRGAFGGVLKKISCTIKKYKCSECLLRESCVYCYVFETPPPRNSMVMRKYPSAPHPFVIEPPVDQKTKYMRGEELEFGLILMGKAMDFLPYFIYAFDELGKIGIGKGKGKFILKDIRAHSLREFELIKRSSYGEELVIYNGEEKIIKPFDKDVLNVSLEFESEKYKTSVLVLNFKTPTRLVYQGQLIRDLEFHILVRQLLRRIGLLSYFHCGGPPRFEFNRIIEKAKDIDVLENELTWYDWERYSSRQATKMKMGGFIGRISFEGEIEPFMPLIRAGSILHAGKGTSFGLGKYEIEKYF